MRSVVLAVVLAAVAGCTPAKPPATPTVAAPESGEIPALVEAVARSENPAAAKQLRAAGPRGFEAVLAAYDAAKNDPDRRERLSRALDVVGAQKDAHAARLYWSTDLDEAKARAKSTGRPILSLRLLGRLDEELSCANSRFFRTALYSNHEVSQMLRDRFVLHWATERPAPLITIDFRDGRTIKRTVTGNSLHYVLDADGRVVDAIPGLYGPQAFASTVSRAGEVALLTGVLEESERAKGLAVWHEESLRVARREWQRSLSENGLARMAFPADMVAPTTRPVLAAPPPAAVAMPIAPSKAAVEMPMIKGTMRTPDVTVPELPWSRIGASRLSECKLDASSIALVKEKRPRSWTDGEGMGRPLADAELDVLVKGFEVSMSADTAKNELVHHAVIHRWLADAARTKSGEDELARLNTRVYAELFKTPASDPWLGLVPPSVFTGIQDDGIAQ